MKNDAAVRSLFDGSKAGKRNQTIITPLYILEAIREVWAGEIKMDPCAAPFCTPSFTNAEFEVRLPDDGLAVEWRDRTFINPPYAELKKWLDRDTGDARVCWLVPVRSHRRWWRAWAWTLDYLYFLDPVKFHGFDSAFPAPLCLGFRGVLETEAPLKELGDEFMSMGALNRDVR